MAKDKRASFIKLAEKRTNEAVEIFRKIGNLSNKSNYEYTETDIQKIFDCLQTTLNETRNRYQIASVGKKRFSLVQTSGENMPFEGEYPKKGNES